MPATSSPPRGGAWTTASWVVAGLLALALLVGVVLVALRLPGYLPGAVADRDEARERAAVVATAEQFTLRMDEVDAADFDAYLESVSEMLTAKARAENQESLEVLRETYEAAEVRGTGEVLSSGVADFSENAATVLVAHNAEVTTNQGDVRHFYRWSVDLVRVDDDWRIDGFTPVT